MTSWLESPRGRRILLAGLVAFAVGMYSLLWFDESTYNSLIDEDRWIEGPGTLALLAASLLFLGAFLRVRRLEPERRPPRLLQASLLLLALVFFVGFGEEISWGQRFLGLETPSDIKRASSQDEINFHNLNALGSGFFDADRLFQLFWFTFGVLVPVASACSVRVRRLLRRLLPIMPLVVSAALVANQFLDWFAHEYFEGRYYNAGYPFSHSLFETKESITSVILAVGAWYVFHKTETGSADALHLAEDDSFGRRLARVIGRRGTPVEQPSPVE